jgi:hypothetical protein
MAMPTTLIHRASEGAPPTVEPVLEITLSDLLRVCAAWAAIVLIGAALGLVAFAWRL